MQYSLIVISSHSAHQLSLVQISEKKARVWSATQVRGSDMWTDPLLQSSSFSMGLQQGSCIGVGTLHGDGKRSLTSLANRKQRKKQHFSLECNINVTDSGSPDGEPLKNLVISWLCYHLIVKLTLFVLPHKTVGVSVGHINSFFHSLISLISVGLGETFSHSLPLKYTLKCTLKVDCHKQKRDLPPLLFPCLHLLRMAQILYC